MTDRYRQIAASPPGRFMIRRLGLPQPAPLQRYEPGQPLLAGPALLGGRGRVGAPAARVLAAAGVESYAAGAGAVDAARAAGLRATAWSPAEGDDRRFAALVFDASGIADTAGLRDVYEFFQPVVPRFEPSGRLVVLGDSGPSVAQRALEGFVRSAAKEVRHGATAQLVSVAPEAEGRVESTLRFLLSARSAYVSGQVVRISAAVRDAPADWDRPLAGKVAAVTGASRGIGAAIAEVLARDGADVVCLDVPAQGEALAGVANRVGGSALQLDITAERAPAALADHVRERHGGVDVVVHNAGITRDRTLARMGADEWDSVIAVNLTAVERLNEALLSGDLLRRGGRIVCVSSVSGIAGNRGQANYATSKAGVIGVVESLAPVLAPRQCTINAVAPGFIETRMTAAMPLATREAGRRLNSLAQGGLPVDVAETVAWFASPGSAGVNGNVVRVCGQSLIGA